MGNTLARQQFSRLPVTETNTDLNFAAVQRLTAGMFQPKIITHALSPYTVAATDWLILCDCTNGAITLTFPLAARIDGAHVMVVKTDSSANAVTLTGTFSGVVNPTLTAQHAMRTIDAGNGVYEMTPKPADIPSGTFPGAYTVTGLLTLLSGQATARDTVGVSVPNATTTTIVTLPNAMLINGTRIIVSMGATTTNVGGVAEIVVAGDAFNLIRHTEITGTISLSGSDVQLNQTSGATLTVKSRVAWDA